MDDRPFLYAPGVHLSLVKPPRVVPGPERHRWDKKNVAWGDSTTCLKCGCTKFRLKTQPEYTERTASLVPPNCSSSGPPVPAAGLLPLPTLPPDDPDHES